MRLRCTTDAGLNACRASFSFERVCNCAKTCDNQCSAQFHTGLFHDQMNNRTSVNAERQVSVQCHPSVSEPFVERKRLEP